jgi:hypothetical protein
MFQRVTARRWLSKFTDRTSNFSAAVTLVFILGACIDTAYRLGWVGAAIIAALCIALYLVGAAGIIPGILDIVKQLLDRISVRVRRPLSWCASRLYRIWSYLANLSRKLAPDLRTFAETMSAKTAKLEDVHRAKTAEEDKYIAQAHERDSERRKKGGQR